MQQEKNYWFRPKRYGYGLVPISLGGWIATLVLLSVVFMAGYAHDIFEPTITQKAICNFIIDLITLTGLFLVLMKDKTKGEIKWNWGKK